MDAVNIYPAKHFVTPKSWIPSAPFAQNCGSGWMRSTPKANCWRLSGWSSAQVRPGERAGQVAIAMGWRPRHRAGAGGHAAGVPD